MKVEEFYATWDRRCERAVLRDLVAFQLRREAKLKKDPLRWIEYLEIWQEFDARAEKLIEHATQDLGWDLDKAEEVVADYIDRERERAYERLGFNRGVR